MTDLYELICLVAAAVCVASALIGALAFRSGFAHPRAWIAIRFAQVAIVLAACFGTALFAGVGESAHRLQYGYSLMAAAVSFAAEQLRLASAATVLSQVGIADSAGVAELSEDEQNMLARRIALRELGVEAIALGVCAALLLRGAAAF